MSMPLSLKQNLDAAVDKHLTGGDQAIGDGKQVEDLSPIQSCMEKAAGKVGSIEGDVLSALEMALADLSKGYNPKDLHEYKRKTDRLTELLTALKELQ